MGAAGWVPELDVGIGAPFKDAVFFEFEAGCLSADCEIKDIHAEASGRCDALLQIPDYERRAGLVFSDLQLASHVARSGEAHRFVKQGLEGRAEYYPKLWLSERRCRIILRSIICRRRESVLLWDTV